MHRVRSNTRLRTLIATTVAVTALGVVLGTGLGAPLLVCGPVSLALGVGLGALLAAGLTPTPEHPPARPVRTFGVRWQMNAQAVITGAPRRRGRRLRR
jgi:hypothetical protein